MNLENLDLNLLIALDALLTERNVTRAAERIHISQPGMSSALQKLRTYFDDPLLERIGRNMELTSRGRGMADPVKAILSQVRDLSDQPKVFDPSQGRRVFRIAATTYCCELLAPAILALLKNTAPTISVHFEELSTSTLDRLLGGQNDFAITISARLIDNLGSYNEVLAWEKLFTDHFVVAVSKSNSLVGETINFDELCELGYVETRFGGVIAGISEQILRQQPRQPRIRGWLPNFQLSLDAVSQSDMATILPSLLIGLKGDRLNVRSLPVPFEMPILEELLFWHRRNNNDLGHRWMAEILTKVAKEVAA